MKKRLLHILTFVSLLFLTNVNYGQAPVLGTVANFVFFTTDGAVTNSGISQVTGSVGSNKGAGTGFGNVNGVMQSQDSATSQCAKDLLNLYNKLDSAKAGYFPSSTLGNGDTLVAGVYSIGGAATLNKTLYLNAKGNGNAVFIIQIKGAFSISAASRIKLLNGAVACNVFWKVEGLVKMATGTNMKGTIIANNAAITMAVDDTLEGRALSTTGAITVDGVMAYTPIGCGSPALTGPVAPDLRTTECYALFSGDGAVSNSGLTHVVGDVGTNVGKTTGFVAKDVKGTIHLIPDSSTKQCMADLTKVYNYLDSLKYDIQLLYPAAFGSNLVLTPHTYLLNAATVLTDSLYLNAQGDANAIFVIKIFGALSTSTYSNIILINGAQSKNVYWLVSGAVSINNYSVFRGTIICSNGALGALNTGVTLDGRALTTGGALTTTAVTATMSAGCGSVFTGVTTQPVNETVCAGSSASFSVIASGTGLKYQWRKGAKDLANGNGISGATSDTITIKPVAAADTASDYNVVITGSNGPNDTSSDVSLEVNTALVITASPDDVAACATSSVGFTVTATGTGLTYQWRKGNVNLIDGANIVGATSDMLTIKSITTSDASSDYNVLITGICSKDSTKNVSLMINPATVIVTDPVDQKVKAGGSVSFSVSATGTSLTYQWKKGTIDLSNGSGISGATTETLTIDPVAYDDSALDYNVVVSGACSSAITSKNASLSISKTTTGIAPEGAGNANNAVTFYPNPFSGSVNIVINGAMKINQCELSIYNALGAEVIYTNITSQTTTIETGSLPSGIYFYKVIDNNQVIQSGKLISQR